MPTEPASPTHYQLGTARFRPSTGEVWAEGRTVRLPPKAARLLQALVGRAGEVLTRNEIKEILWPGGKVEFDQGINFLVRTIRKALHDSAESPRYIETLPKRGYRLIAPVTVVDPESPAPPEPAAPSAPATSATSTTSTTTSVATPEHPRRGTPRSAKARAWGLAAAAAAVVFVLFLTRGSFEPPALPVLAIVPLLSEDASAGTRAEGERVAEALTVEFTSARSDQLRVLGPAATSRITADGSEALAVRRELGACLVLSGSVRDLDAGRIVLFLQVIRTADQAHLWARLDTVPSGGLVDSALESARRARRDLGAVVPEYATGCPT